MADPHSSEIRFERKRVVHVHLCVILRGTFPDRGLELILHPTRAVRAGDVIELMCAHGEAAPGSTVRDADYIGFAEIMVSGVLRIGDEVWWLGRCVARVVGFDETHMPNHLNVVLTPVEGFDPISHTFELEDELIFEMPREEK